MRRFIVAVVLALSLIVVAVQPASAGGYCIDNEPPVGPWITVCTPG
jgi:hypothetical protein